MNTDSFQKLLDSFCERHEYPQTMIDDDGYCGIYTGEGVTILLRFDADTEQFELHAQLGRVPPEKLEVVAPQLMYANCYWHGTGGATLSIEEGTREVYLQYQLPTDGLELDRLSAIYEGFLGNAGEWYGMLQEHLAKPAPSPNGGDAQPRPDLPESGFIKV